MLNQFFPSPQIQERMREGPLGCYVDHFAALLNAQGYSRDYSSWQIRLIADFSRWLDRHGIRTCDLNGQSIKRYLQYRRRGRRTDQFTLTRLLNLLREKGIIEQEPLPKIKSACQKEIDRFHNYLLKERGLFPTTLAYYLLFVRRFLKNRFGKGAIQLSKLRAQDVTDYVRRRALSLSHGRKPHLTTALRTFLRYLQYRGDIKTDLAACVPAVANWNLSGLPRFIESHQIQRVLDRYNRQTPKGLRNYAILLLLARLGLRAGEVVALTLDDIHWETGEITIHGKGEHISRLPLPRDVGQAIALYLKNGRPPCSTRRVFVILCAPWKGFTKSNAISTLAGQALKQAGIHAPHLGAHLFRHSLATHMLRRGASLGEIGQILRHRQINTTAIYAKVDLVALQNLARPWLGGTL